MELQVTILSTNNLHTVKWFQVFLSKINNYDFKKLFLFDSEQVLSFQIRVKLGIKVMKEYTKPQVSRTGASPSNSV